MQRFYHKTRTCLASHCEFVSTNAINFQAIKNFTTLDIELKFDSKLNHISDFEVTTLTYIKRLQGAEKELRDIIMDKELF